MEDWPVFKAEFLGNDLLLCPGLSAPGWEQAIRDKCDCNVAPKEPRSVIIDTVIITNDSGWGEEGGRATIRFESVTCNWCGEVLAEHPS